MNSPESDDNQTAEGISPIVPKPLEFDDFDKSRTAQYSLATLLLLITSAAIFLAVTARDPGFAIGLAILSLPAFIRTSLLVRRRQELGKQTRAELKIASFLGSLVTVTVASVVVVVASVGTFCGICLTAGTDKAIPFAGLFALGATVAVIIVIAKWVGRRWRRDVARK